MLPTTAYADNVTVTTAYSDAYFQTFSSKGVWTNIGTPAHYITETGQVVYCVQTSKTEPTNAPYYEVSGESAFSSSFIRRGIEIIIQNGYPTTTNGFSDSEARYATANAIRFFLVDCGAPYVPTWMDLDLYSQFFRARSGYESLWDWCMYLRSLANNQSSSGTVYHSVSFSTPSLALTEDGAYFVGQSTVTLSGCEGGYRLDTASLPSGASISGYTGNNGDVLTVYIPTAYENGWYTLFATGSGYASQGALEFYAPSYDGSLQTVVTYVGADLGNLSDVANAAMSVTTPAATPKLCSITITKCDSETNALLANAGYRLNCPDGTTKDGYTNANGVLVFSDLPIGDYSYFEFEAPDGYTLDSTDYTIQFNTAGMNDSHTLYNNPIRVSLTIQKQDADTGTVLENAGYRLFSEGAQIAEGYTDENGNVTFENLAIGTYTFFEFDPPDGYLLDSNEHTITLDGSSTAVQEIHRDTPCKADIIITKLDTDTQSKLEGAGFRLFDADGNPVREGYTNNEGSLTFSDLPLGSYTLKEFEAPDGFTCSDVETSFTFTDSHLSETVTMYNTRRTATISIHKVNAVGDALNGAAFILETSTDNGDGWVIVSDQLTDQNGYVVWEDLSTAPGTLYRLTETSSVPGQSLQTETVFEGSLPEDDIYDVSFTVCNCAIPTLPFTGGSGFGYIPVLMLMLGMGFFLAQIRKRKKDNI